MVFLLGTALARALLDDTWGEAAWFGLVVAACNVIAMLVAGAFTRFGRTHT
jgi:hypothetical protein